MFVYGFYYLEKYVQPFLAFCLVVTSLLLSFLRYQISKCHKKFSDGISDSTESVEHLEISYFFRLAGGFLDQRC